jgi:two-component system sensor histidine kinase MprB
MTLRTRIAAVASLSVALAVLAAATGLYVAVRSDLRGEIDSALRALARAFTPAARAPAAGADGAGPDGPDRAGGPGWGRPSSGAHASGPRGFPARVQPAPFGAASGYVELISPAGTISVPGGQGVSPTSVPVTAVDRAIAARGSASSLTDRSVGGTRLRVLTVGAPGAGAILVARPLTEVQRELNRLVLLLALIGAGGIVLAALLGALVARTALSPVARFTRRTENLTGNLDLSLRLQVKGRDELTRLAESFNSTLDALERSVKAQRHLIADASHELRTPISSLRANVQILGEAERLSLAEQESLRADIIEELDELTALVGDVVELARGAAPEEPVDEVRLDELVEAAVQRAQRRSHDLQFVVDLEPTTVRGKADRINRAASNVVDNARRWSPAGAQVEVAVKDGVLAVRDHGPGFVEADLPYVFDRFYRAHEARKLPGSGLGLAIVRQAAEACGGFAEAQNAPDGGALLRVGFGAAVKLASEGHADAGLAPLSR